MDLDEAIDSGNIDELIREIDSLASSLQWPKILEMIPRCYQASERGFQLWPAANWAEFVLARDAPGEVSCEVLHENAGKFGPGPLPEVVATTHSFAECKPYLQQNPVADWFCMERVARGEAVDVESAEQLPGKITSWEPTYCDVNYRELSSFDLRPNFGGEGLERIMPTSTASRLPADDLVRTIQDSLAHWSSTGSEVVVASYDGVWQDAVANFGVGAVLASEISAQEALREFAWAAASGGENGRRRGVAAARLDVWFLVSILSDTDTENRAETPRSQCLERDTFVRWKPEGPDRGWWCRLAIHDPIKNRTWVLRADSEPSPPVV